MNTDRVLLSHGGGGRQAGWLIQNYFVDTFQNPALACLDDAAEFTIGNRQVAFTTDSYTVKPIFFPGGNIGTLAVCGTVNDLTAKGAKPVAISAGFIIEEGFLLSDLKTIINSMQDIAGRVPVPIVTGDTKVVKKGEADGIFINTSGVGLVQEGMDISSTHVKIGDDIIVTGTIAEHGLAILNAREHLGFTPEIQSDVAPLSVLLPHLRSFAPHIHAMRDPTRGGLAGILNEIAQSSRVTAEIFEEKIPVRDDVRACCDLLGLDPLYIANEGKMVLWVSESCTEELLNVLRNELGFKNAVCIGKISADPYRPEVPAVSLKTRLGSRRFVPLLEGDPLPRIC